MKKNHLFLLILIILLASFLSACGGTGAAASWPGLSVDQNRAYLAYNQFVYAVDLQTGQLLWRYPSEKAESNTTFFAPPGLTPDGNIIVGSYTQNGNNSRLISLDAENGSVQNVFDQAKNNYIAAPMVTEKGIYAPNADGKLYALDFDLNLRWVFPTERAIWASPTTNENCNCIYLASMDHSLYSVDADSGSLNWKTPDLGGALAAPPTFGSGDTLYIGTSDKQLLALDAQTGKTIWVYNTPGWIWSGAVLQNGSLYLGDLEGNLIALNAETGTEKWSVKADGAIVSKPLVHNDQVYYSTENNNVYAVDLDGNPTWRQETSAKVYAPVLAAGDLILVSLTDTDVPLVAYDLNGNLRWSFSLATE